MNYFANYFKYKWNSKDQNVCVHIINIITFDVGTFSNKMKISNLESFGFTVLTFLTYVYNSRYLILELDGYGNIRSLIFSSIEYYSMQQSFVLYICKAQTME